MSASPKPTVVMRASLGRHAMLVTGRFYNTERLLLALDHTTAASGVDKYVVLVHEVNDPHVSLANDEETKLREALKLRADVVHFELKDVPSRLDTVFGIPELRAMMPGLPGEYVHEGQTFWPHDDEAHRRCMNVVLGMYGQLYTWRIMEAYEEAHGIK